MSNKRKGMFLRLLVIPLILLSNSLYAEGRQPIQIGTIDSAKLCTTYVMSSGESGLVISRDVIAIGSRWTTWLEKDCLDNFATLKSSLESALASSNLFSIGSRGYIVDMTVSDVGNKDITQSNDQTTSVSIHTKLFVSADIRIRDNMGNIIYGGVFTKHIDTDASGVSGGVRYDSHMSGKAVYGVLQHELALAAARVIALHIVPLQVVKVDGGDIQLNYGSPLLQLGSLVQVSSKNRMRAIMYRVISATESGAIAEKEGDGDSSSIALSDNATIIESDNPAANSRRMKRVSLP